MSSTPPQRDHITFDNSPARLTAILSLVAGGVAVIATGIVSLLALLFGVLGWLLLGVGLLTSGSGRAVSLGAGGIFICLLIGGVFGMPSELLIVGMLGVILAWDFGHHSIIVGRQLGTTARTIRTELLHIAGSLSVGVIAAALSYLTYRLAMAGQPFPALVLVLIAVVVFTWSIRT